MKINAKYIGSQKAPGGSVISFAVAHNTNLEDIDNKLLELTVEEYKDKRSLQANRYFWELCSKMANKLGVNKETVYLMELKGTGLYEPVAVVREAIAMLQPFYRLVEVDHTYSATVEGADGESKTIEMAEVHCYKGSHEYNREEMSALINLTVNDAQDLGIETWNQEEIDYYCNLWRAH